MRVIIVAVPFALCLHIFCIVAGTHIIQPSVVSASSPEQSHRVEATSTAVIGLDPASRLPHSRSRHTRESNVDGMFFAARLCSPEQPITHAKRIFCNGSCV